MGLVAAPPTPLLEAASTFRPRAPNLCGFKSAKIHERLSRRKSDFGRILPQISVGRKVLATVKAWKKICCGERQRSKSRDPSQFLRPCSFGQQRPGFPSSSKLELMIAQRTTLMLHQPLFNTSSMKSMLTRQSYHLARHAFMTNGACLLMVRRCLYQHSIDIL